MEAKITGEPNWNPTVEIEGKLWIRDARSRTHPLSHNLADSEVIEAREAVERALVAAVEAAEAEVAAVAHLAPGASDRQTADRDLSNTRDGADRIRKALAELRTAEEERAREAAEAAEAAAEAKAQEALREWAQDNGSALLLARIEDAYSWQALARQEFADTALADLPLGERTRRHPGELRENPTLAEIEAVRAVQSPCVTATLYRGDFADYENCDYDTTAQWRTYLEVECEAPDGEVVTRHYFLP